MKKLTSLMITVMISNIMVITPAMAQNSNDVSSVSTEQVDNSRFYGEATERGFWGGAIKVGKKVYDKVKKAKNSDLGKHAKKSAGIADGTYEGAKFVSEKQKEREKKKNEKNNNDK